MFLQSGVTVRDILKLDCMREIKLVAGHQGVGRVINNVNVMEVPDIVNWVKAGDLLLTTAYSIRNDIEALAGLVPALAAKGLAGLALKPKRYLDSIPEQMLEQADKMGFPLLELPIETSFSELINPILSEILQIQTVYHQKSAEAHRLFMEVVLKGGRLEDIANTLARLIENSVVILDDRQVVLAKSLNNWGNQAFEETLSKYKDASMDIFDPLNSGVKYYRAKLQSMREYRTAIMARGQTRGFFSVWENNRPLSQNDFIFIERALTVAALEILNEKSLMEIERRYRNEFLEDLLRETKTGDRELILRARYLGWDLNLNYAAYVFDLMACNRSMDQAKLNREAQQAKEQAFYFITHGLKPGEQFIAGTKSDRIILLLSQPKGLGEEETRLYFERRAGELLGKLANKIPAYATAIGVGRFYPGIPGLRKSYAEAVKALDLCANPLKSQVIFFQRLGINRLLQQITDFADLESFYRETIYPLDSYDRSTNSDLVNTLQSYFSCNGNLKQTAKALFTHYNTILYRLERIERITNLSLKSPENRLNLQVGLKIRQILQERNSLGKEQNAN